MALYFKRNSLSCRAVDEGKEVQDGETENEAVRRSMLDACAVEWTPKQRMKRKLPESIEELR